MRRWTKKWATPAMSMSLLGALYACGSPDEQTLFPPSADASNDGVARDTGSIVIGPGDGDGGVVVQEPDGAVCAGTTQQAQRLPLHLVVLFDKSSSMCQYDPADPSQAKRDCSRAESRWQVSASALTSFFSSPDTQGITVTAVAFPKRSSGSDTLAQRQANVCQTKYYNGINGDDSDGINDKEIDAIALPNANAASGLISTPPTQTGMITPTKFAAKGGISLAASIKSSTGVDTAVVLFTDGQPGWCEADSTPDSSANVNAELQAGVSQGISTYVVGIVASGDTDYAALRTSLNGFAAAGGSGSANIVEMSNPSLSATAIVDALNNIRTKAASCDLAMPTSNGQGTVDPRKVNLLYTPGTGSARSLVASADCSDPSGWRYDNPNAPTKIQLCPDICADLKADRLARVDVVLGCLTAGGPQ